MKKWILVGFFLFIPFFVVTFFTKSVVGHGMLLPIIFTSGNIDKIFYTPVIQKDSQPPLFKEAIKDQNGVYWLKFMAFRQTVFGVSSLIETTGKILLKVEDGNNEYITTLRFNGKKITTATKNIPVDISFQNGKLEIHDSEGRLTEIKNNGNEKEKQ